MKNKQHKSYLSPVLTVMNVRPDVLTTSSPDGFYNQYQAGEGLSPNRQNIWDKQ